MTIEGLHRKLSKLLVFDLSINKLSGVVPWKKLVSSPDSFLRTDVPFFSSTTVLNVSHNSLSSPVDPSISQLKGLHAVDLNSNKFSGRALDNIADITDLDFLDLSNKKFSGLIAPKLRKFQASSFQGNSKLCGTPLSKSC
ncbi:hypothetical protein R1sor_005632 [Riccia sorocarpa]|uniref:Polygalacturonase inhibitor protein n=1 Tax=Riccia sorocarpa TaxID=122646 RepID=A0ABD3HM25_9MARC